MSNLIERIHSSPPYRLMILWMLYYPLLSIIVSLPFSGFIALAENTSWKNAFGFELQMFTGSVIPLTPWAPGGGTGGFIIVNLVALAHQIILAIFVGLSAGPMIEGMINISYDPFKGFDPEGSLFVPRTKSGLFLKIILFYFIIVAVTILWSVWWGGFMAWSEGWPFLDGFVTAVGVMTSGLTALEPDKFPVTTGGMFCGFYIGIMGAAMLGLIIAVCSVPLLGMDLSYEDSPAVRIFPMLLLSKEQREKLGIKGSCEKGGASGEEEEEEKEEPTKDEGEKV